MSEFSDLQTIGFRETTAQMGVVVAIDTNSVSGLLTPGPFVFTSMDTGEEIEVDQSVDVLTSDLTTLGLTDLEAACTARQRVTVDGKACRLISFSAETADPTTKLFFRIAR